MRLRGSAKRLKRAIRALDRRRREEALDAWWHWAITTEKRWPQPERLFHMVLDVRTRRSYFVRITEEEAQWEARALEVVCAESVDAVESTEPYSCIEGK